MVPALCKNREEPAQGGVEGMGTVVLSLPAKAGHPSLDIRARLASIEWQIGGRIAAGKDRGALVIDHVLYSGV